MVQEELNALPGTGETQMPRQMYGTVEYIFSAGGQGRVL